MGEITRIVREMRASGQTQKEFCETHGIKLRTFRDWVSVLKRRENESAERDKEDSSVSWLELGKSETRIRGVSRPVIEISVGRYAVSVTGGFDRALFMEVCEVLSSLC
jgi:orotate phosphoribosyltransferase-like protein